MAYRLKVTQQWKLVIAMVFCPLAVTSLFLLFILRFRNLPDWAVIVAAFTIMGAALALTVFVVFKWLTVECEVSLSDEGFSFHLIQRTPFMQLDDFSCNWANITNAAVNENRQNNKFFYSIEFREGRTLYFDDISAKNEKQPAPSAFWEELNTHVQQFNDSAIAPELKIKDSGFYDKPWATVFTWIMLFFTVILVGAAIFMPEDVPWYKVGALFAFLVPWTINYFYAQKKRKENTGL
jgi:hypothetical protein